MYICVFVVHDYIQIYLQNEYVYVCVCVFVCVCVCVCMCVWFKTIGSCKRKTVYVNKIK